MLLITRDTSRAASLLAAAVTWLFVGLSGAWAQSGFIDVSGSFNVTRSGLVLNRSTNTYDSMVTLKNVGKQNIHAPLQVVVTISPSSVTLANKVGATSDGKPLIQIGLLDNYALPQETFTQKLAFSNPNRVTFSFITQLRAASAPDPVVVKITEVVTGGPSEPQALVAGLLSGPPGTGVTVNGQAACVFNGQFFVNGLSIESNTTAVIATGTSPAGASGQDSVSFTPSTQQTGLRVIAQSPCGGVAPFQATFYAGAIEIDPSVIQSIDADFDGNGTTDYSSSNISQPITATYTSAGTYRVRFTLHETGGNTHQITQVVRVLDSVEAQKPMQSLYSSLLSALVLGNIPHALSYFTAGGQAIYRPILQQIRTQLPAILAGWSTMQPLILGDQYSEFGILRTIDGVQYLYTIMFIRDADGAWKISSL